MNKEEFEKELQKQLDELPFTKHLDDGQYNDGQLTGFEAGARWAFALSNVVGSEAELVCVYCGEPTNRNNTKIKLCHPCQKKV